MAHVPPSFVARLNSLMRVPPCEAVTELYEAWMKAEGGSAANNPLNTTYYLSGATSYNTAGVRNYLDGVQGIAATGLTLRLPAYRLLWADMQHAKAQRYTARDLVTRNRQAFDTWGTGADSLLRLL